jgi:hypothetical protein
VGGYGRSYFCGYMSRPVHRSIIDYHHIISASPQVCDDVGYGGRLIKSGANHPNCWFLHMKRFELGSEAWNHSLAAEPTCALSAGPRPISAKV